MWNIDNALNHILDTNRTYGGAAEAKPTAEAVREGFQRL